MLATRSLLLLCALLLGCADSVAETPSFRPAHRVKPSKAPPAPASLAIDLGTSPGDSLRATATWDPACDARGCATGYYLELTRRPAGTVLYAGIASSPFVRTVAPGTNDSLRYALRSIRGTDTSAVTQVTVPLPPSDTTPPPPPPPPGSGFHVATNGTSGGSGTVSSPWNLTTALARSFSATDTVWVHGGTYRQALFRSDGSGGVFREYPGERWTFDGSLDVFGANRAFWGFKSTSTFPDQRSGINIFASGTRLINCVVYDHTINGIGTWSEGPNTEIYGCLVYNNGRMVGGAGGFGHGIYGQNSVGNKWVRDNIVFQQFGYGLHMYTEGGELTGIQLVGNITFNNGAPASTRQSPNIEIGGGVVVRGGLVAENIAWTDRGGGTNCYIGYSTTLNSDAVVRGNVCVGGGPALRVMRWTTLTVSDNRIVGDWLLHLEQPAPSGWSWTGNHWYSANPQAWVFPGDSYTWPEFKTRANIGATDLVSTTPPTAPYVLVRPNTYERGRANVGIINWGGAASVSAAIPGLAPGQAYEVRNVQNFFGAPVATGTYTGSISFPMGPVTPPAPARGTLASLPSTGTAFHAFVVLPR